MRLAIPNIKSKREKRLLSSRRKEMRTKEQKKDSKRRSSKCLLVKRAQLKQKPSQKVKQHPNINPRKVVDSRYGRLKRRRAQEKSNKQRHLKVNRLPRK